MVDRASVIRLHPGEIGVEQVLQRPFSCLDGPRFPLELLLLGQVLTDIHAILIELGELPCPFPCLGQQEGWVGPELLHAAPDANALYQRGDYEGAAVLYEDALQSDPDLVVAHFYLANSYDNQFRPGVRGDADDDRLLQLAIQEYIVAIDQETDIARRTLAMQHLRAAYLKLAGFYRQNEEFDKTIEALRARAVFEPDDPEAPYTIGTYYWEKVYRDSSLNGQQQQDYIVLGLTELDKALELRTDYMEALVYKNILLRMQANRSKDVTQREQLIAEADRLRNQARELQKRRASGVS